MPAVPPYSLLQKIRSLFRRIPAGCNQGNLLALPYGRTRLIVILVHGVDAPVKQSLHGRRAVPGIHRACQDYQLRLQYLREDFLQPVIYHAGGSLHVLLTASAGSAGFNVHVVQVDCLHLNLSVPGALCTTAVRGSFPLPLQFLCEHLYQRICVALRPWACR